MPQITPPPFFTEDQVQPMLDSIAKTAKKCQERNKRPARPRDSGTIKLQLDNLKQRRADNSRYLTEHESHRVEVLAAIDKCASKIAAREAAGLQPDQNLVGYSFLSANKVDTIFHNGLQQNLDEELQRTEKEIKTLTEGAKNLSALCDVEIPKLEAELQESIRLEQLGG